MKSRTELRHSLFVRPDLATSKRFYPPVLSRFFDSFTVGDSCWEWQRQRLHGYGVFHLPKRTSIGAHRLSFELFNGDFDLKLDVLHRCDNPPCVRPSHLMLGTHHENMLDAANKLRMSHGEPHPRARLTDDAVRAIRTSTESNATLSNRFGVSAGRIRDVRNGMGWRHVS